MNEELKNDNDFVIKTIKWLDYLCLKYVDCNADTYFKKLKFLQSIGNAYLSEEEERHTRAILLGAKIEKMHENIFKILHPEADLSKVDPDEINRTSLCNLNDNQLVNYFALYCRSVTFNQKGNLAVLKYSPVVYEIGWNKFALMCRGKVVDLKKYKIVSYPYDKFFNLNENDDYREEHITNLISNAKDVIVSEKIDGSLIAVTRLSSNEDDFLITTNGSFENLQVDLARKMLDEQYKTFKKYAPTGKTFIFEIVHPDDPHCISYGNTKKLFLHGVRDLDSFRLIDHAAMYFLAIGLELDVVNREYLDFETMKSRVHESNANKEGWVIRIIGKDDSEKIVKLKYDEYFVLHRLKDGVNVKKVYNHYVFVGDIQDMLLLMLPDIREATLGVIEEINISRQKIIAKSIDVATKLADIAKINVGSQLTPDERKACWEASKSLKKTPYEPWTPLAVKYLNTGTIERDVNSLRYERYSELVDNLD